MNIEPENIIVFVYINRKKNPDQHWYISGYTRVLRYLQSIKINKRVTVSARNCLKRAHDRMSRIIVNVYYLIKGLIF